MQWIASLETGFDDVDNQHKELFEKLGAFLDAYEKREDEKVVLDLFEFLTHYVQEHFQSEEKYMKKYHYPGMSEHIKEHNKLLEVVRLFKVRYKQEGFTDHFMGEVKKVMTDWLLDHIVKTDMELGRYLQKTKMI